MRAFVVALVMVLGANAYAGGRRGGGGGGRHSSSSGRGTGSSSQSVHVKSYTTKRGSYVAPARRTKSDHTQLNNYSTKGNVNTWTGAKGTKAAKR